MVTILIETPSDRLLEIMNMEGWTQNDLAEFGETSKQSVSRYIRKKRGIDFDFVYNLQQRTGYNSLWILKGIGPRKIPAELRTKADEDKFFEKVDRERAILRKLDKFPGAFEFLERVSNLKPSEFNQLRTYLERMFP
ncbi:helix-turn-helix transcriptional regulator [Leptospira weilii]|uniref:helix-turn-helix domain-containing protein n=1 Tax=Leptospira weilii TaxID=28184 RepID=UPI00201B5BF5|nr:helix-turn-helix transcriptional regulator [Leptospira weilii]UPY79904.1 helix-turn-helix transcriptional regulator [Leptospira weilii]UPY80334.1 helix-turn-helix transcriptional regulator [Leptospira weilii]UPY80357.1 helix-turn-helix transcriptional regulator [Leptospira weilii]UPY80824.1 helix-turn-helix transcriptional regulator [Leptospira weilii]